jgi:hypothetical protein
MRNPCRLLMAFVFAAVASLALAQDEPPPVTCMDDMNPGAPQPIVLGVWFGGGTTDYPISNTAINGMGSPTMTMFVDWRYDEEEGQIVKTIHTYGGTVAPYIAIGGAASSRTFSMDMVKRFVCRIDNDTQSWVLYDDYNYQSFSDAEPTGNPNQNWGRSATETLYYSAFNPTFVDDNGNVQQNQSKEVLKTRYSSDPNTGPVPFGAAPSKPLYPSPPGAVGSASGSDDFTDKYGNVVLKWNYVQQVQDDNPPNGVARTCTFDYNSVNTNANLTQSFHRDYDINTQVFNVSETTNGGVQSGQLIWRKGVTWNYLTILQDESSFRNHDVWGQLGFEMLDWTSWLYFWNADPGLESP